MKVFVTGGTGLIGRALVKQLVNGGHQVTVLTRQFRASESNIRYIQAISSLVERPDVVINLAGAGLADKRWTASYKREIRASRIGLTELLVAHLRVIGFPDVFISGSAIGYYGASDDQQFDESFGPGQGFSADLCRDWEASVEPMSASDTRYVFLRTGVVLDRLAGAYPKMTQSFKFGMGSWMGKGEHWLSWIHLDDMVGGIIHCMTTPALAGPVNLTAPQPVTHRAFSAEIARHRRPLLSLGLPAPIMRLALGEMADDLLLTGQKVVPTKLLAADFSFAYPTIRAAACALEV